MPARPQTRYTDDMIDIHNHILPGIDDGAADLDETVMMAKIAVQDGITDIIATPHIMNDFLTRKAIQQKVDIVNQALREAEIAVQVHPGAEVMVHMLSNENARLGLAGSPYLLIEFSPYNIMGGAGPMFSVLTQQGYQIIIAHPERHPSVIADPDRILQLLVPGVSLQITAGSLTGDFGPDAKACARYLLKKKAISYMASDAHHDRGRTPALSEAVRQATKLLNEDLALALVEDNPRAILNSVR